MRILFSSWGFLIALCLIFFHVNIVLVSGQCQNDQRMLLQLKNILNFNSSLSTKLVNWNESEDYCRWSGVTCVNSCVTGLDLSNESISDGINSSSSLFKLHNLQQLNLAYNGLNSSPIPPTISDLKNLTYLNLSNAGFSGQIPIEVSHLTRLEVLDLSVFYFPGISSLILENPNFTTFVQKFTELSELYLDGVNISASGNEWCQALSASLLKLEVLSLSSCYLSGPIDDCLLELRSLSVVRLDNNNLSTTAPEFLANFSNLTSLKLSSSGLYGMFPQKIFQVPTLRTLDISNNMLQGSLPQFLHNGSLQSLVLSNTQFSGSLPDSIGYLKMLSRIDLSSCNFSGGIPSSVTNLTQLVYIDLSMNRFTGPIPSFSMAKNLTQVILSQNLLNGSISSNTWGGLLKLVNLDLRNNSLRGSIPPSLFEIPSLQRLQLSHNQFSGYLGLFSNVSSSLLDTLDLSSNKLSGQFPKAVFGLHGLKILDLSFNNFNGSLSLESIQQLRNLSNLDLSYNNLSIDVSGINSSSSSFSTVRLASCNITSIPPFLKDQSILTYLDLSNNQITGEIPKWIWTLSSLIYLNLSSNLLTRAEGPMQSNKSILSVLDLHSNQLQGPIPIIPPSATYLDYSGNNFSAIIPDNIGTSISYTIFFSLANNNLRGGIPTSVCTAQYLQVLDLSNNSLSGQIPKCLTTNMQSLEVLNLRRNQFSGNLTDTFQKSCSLKTLDLNGNQFKGSLPPSLANCTKLEVLNLGNNQISDSFPCWLKNVSSLRVLVLRANKFSGSIACKEDGKTWTKLQIVDIANNNFSGHLPQNCLKTWQAMMVIENGAQSKPGHLGVKVLEQVYYQDTVTVTSKGLEMELVKILTIYTSIDFSKNKFEGQIPEIIGEFKALYFLNLSHNTLTGQIPTSLANLSQLQSLDLSSNKLNGTIPDEIASLNFLSFLNLSYNQLSGSIPISTQLGSFLNTSYIGNTGLCGFPLMVSCMTPPAASETQQHTDPSVKLDWQFILTGSGFGIGAAMAILPLMLWKSGRKWCDKYIDQFLGTVFPLLGLSYISQEDREESSEDDCTDNHSDHGKDTLEDQVFQGQFCVFCSKLDISRRRVIHNPKCMCHQ